MGRGWLLVGSVIPCGFASYAQLLHAEDPGSPLVPWATRWSCQPLGATSLFSDVGTSPAGLRWTAVANSPRFGDLACATVTVLARGYLHRDWSGCGDLDVDVATLIDLAPEITASGRRYALYRGRIAEIATVLRVGFLGRFVTPSAWWPEDRAWCVATEIDAQSTQIGGSAALIQRLLADPSLEVWPAALDDPFDGPHPGQPEWR